MVLLPGMAVADAVDPLGPPKEEDELASAIERRFPLGSESTLRLGVRCSGRRWRPCGGLACQTGVPGPLARRPGGEAFSPLPGAPPPPPPLLPSAREVGRDAGVRCPAVPPPPCTGSTGRGGGGSGEGGTLRSRSLTVEDAPLWGPVEDHRKEEDEGRAERGRAAVEGGRRWEVRSPLLPSFSSSSTE